MNISDEIYKLQQLRESGALTDEEFTRAKDKVLSAEVASFASTGRDVSQHLERIQLQNEIERLDREWELEREAYMVKGKHGAHVPSEGGSLIAGLVIGGFGLAWTIGAASMGAPAIFPVFGVVFILLGVGGCISEFGKAGEYHEAHRRYQKRRAELLAQDNKARR